jgi:O-antigen/teichoic acid export membrane protein
MRRLRSEVPLARAQGGSSHLLRGAYSLVASTAVTCALGLAFWVAAARVYPSATVGRDSVLISVMIELSTVCQLNLGNGIVCFLPGLAGRFRVRLLAGAYAVSAAVALAAGALFVLLAPLASGELGYLHGDAALAIAFVGALVLWGVFVLQDAALTAARQAPWIPLENAVFGALKLAALPLLALPGARHGVFLAWALPIVVLLVPVNAFLFKHALARGTAVGREAELTRVGPGRAARFLAQDYLASVFAQATLTALPLLVIARLGARASAWFAMPFAIAIAFDTFAYGACAALVAEAARDAGELTALMRLFARRVLAPLVPAAGLVAALAPLMLAPFGAAYARHGAAALRLLLCASVLRLALALFSALLRATRRGTGLALLELALLATVLAAAVPLAGVDGIDGVAGGWLAANALAVLAILPALMRALRARRALRRGRRARPARAAREASALPRRP